MLRLVLIITGALVAIIMLPILIGLFLPQHHHAASTVVLKQPPDSVWKVIRNFGAYAEWWPNVKSVERSDRGDTEVWIQRDKHNQPMPLAVVESAAPTRLVTRIADDKLPFGGTWTYEIAAAPAGSKITVTEDGEIYNPLFRTVSRFVMGYHGTMDGYLRALGRRLGEDVEPRHVS